MPRSDMPDDARLWLIAAGVLSVLAALAHLAMIYGGPGWYRFFGAGESMALMAEHGFLRPTLYTIGIASVLGIWAAYAFSGAGLIPRLPLLRTGLVTISLIYLVRAAVLPAMLVVRPTQVTPFWVWSSAIVAAYGIAYAVGTARGWRAMSERTR
jgi:hypothetical protein